MLDGSLLPLEKNIKTVKGVVETAKEYGATVEAELGVVGGNEGEGKSHKILCTNPDDAKRFCDETGVDALAVAIGNAHGNYPVLPELRFDVLEEIHKKVNTPLVLHGGTGISDEQFQRAISLGVRKINMQRLIVITRKKPIILSSPPVRLRAFIKMLKDILKFSIWNN